MSDTACRHSVGIKGKGKGPVLDTALLHVDTMLTISEVANDWHELMIPQRIMRPSIARASEQLDPVQHVDIPSPQTAAVGLHAVARKLPLISRPAQGRRLSRPEHTVG